MGTDGNGIRSLVLIAGCPLRCKFCINPFTWDGSQPARLLSADEIYSEIYIDEPYILATNGGITFGGGEPLLYPRLINEMRTICDPDMTVYVETSLHVVWENIWNSAQSIGMYFIDIKTTDPFLYKEYTGEELGLAIENLWRLLEIKSPESVVVRIPTIPGMA